MRDATMIVTDAMAQTKTPQVKLTQQFRSEYPGQDTDNTENPHFDHSHRV